jgi:hypothetical protein
MKSTVGKQPLHGFFHQRARFRDSRLDAVCKPSQLPGQHQFNPHIVVAHVHGTGRHPAAMPPHEVAGPDFLMHLQRVAILRGRGQARPSGAGSHRLAEAMGNLQRLAARS